MSKLMTLDARCPCTLSTEIQIAYPGFMKPVLCDFVCESCNSTVRIKVSRLGAKERKSKNQVRVAILHVKASPVLLQIFEEEKEAQAKEKSA